MILNSFEYSFELHFIDSSNSFFSISSSVQDLSEVLKKVEVVWTGSHSQARTKLESGLGFDSKHCNSYISVRRLVIIIPGTSLSHEQGSGCSSQCCSPR